MRLLGSIVVSLSLAFPLDAFGQPQTCAIAYGKAKKAFYEAQTYEDGVINEKKNFVCYQIGEEYNSRGKALEEKPIFACCQLDYF